MSYWGISVNGTRYRWRRCSARLYRNGNKLIMLVSAHVHGTSVDHLLTMLDTSASKMLSKLVRKN